jgi:hypothetical protein
MPVITPDPAGETAALKSAAATTTVANVAALSAVNVTSLPTGHEAHVQSLDADFQLNLASALTIDGITVLGTSGAGRWLRMSNPSPRWTAQSAWFVHPTLGLDENDGSSSATPGTPGVGALKTLAEWCRRVTRMKFGTVPQYDITCLGPIPSTDCWRPTGEIEPQPGGGNNVFPVILRGQQTSVFSGTTGAGSAITVPATNTQAIFDGGAGFVPATHIGKMVVAAGGLTAWITKDLGGTLAQVSEWVTVGSTTTGSSPAVTLAAAPGAGVAYDIMDLTSFDAEFMSVGSPQARYRFVDLDLVPSANATPWSIKCLGFTFTRCRIQRKIGFVGANGQVNACGIDFAAITTWSGYPGNNTIMLNCGLRNVEVHGVVGSLLTLHDCHIQGGYVHVVNTNTVPDFGGAFPAGGQIPPSVFNVRGTRGLGVFNSPAGKSGVTIKRGAKMYVLAGGLYGAGNTLWGLEAQEGGEIFILASITPTITGASGDLQLEAAASAMPALEPAAGLVLPALSALATWANWTGAPFSRNVMSYKSGAKIVSVSA